MVRRDGEHDGCLDAVIVTEIVAYPRKRVLEVKFVAGDNLRRWLKPLTETLDAHAREHNCAAMMATGRRGWGGLGVATVTQYCVVREL